MAGGLRGGRPGPHGGVPAAAADSASSDARSRTAARQAKRRSLLGKGSSSRAILAGSARLKRERERDSERERARGRAGGGEERTARRAEGVNDRSRGVKAAGAAGSGRSKGIGEGAETGEGGKKTGEERRRGRGPRRRSGKRAAAGSSWRAAVRVRVCVLGGEHAAAASSCHPAAPPAFADNTKHYRPM